MPNHWYFLVLWPITECIPFPGQICGCYSLLFCNLCTKFSLCILKQLYFPIRAFYMKQLVPIISLYSIHTICHLQWMQKWHCSSFILSWVYPVLLGSTMLHIPFLSESAVIWLSHLCSLCFSLTVLCAKHALAKERISVNMFSSASQIFCKSGLLDTPLHTSWAMAKFQIAKGGGRLNEERHPTVIMQTQFITLYEVHCKESNRMKSGAFKTWKRQLSIVSKPFP